MARPHQTQVPVSGTERRHQTQEYQRFPVLSIQSIRNIFPGPTGEPVRSQSGCAGRSGAARRDRRAVLTSPLCGTVPSTVNGTGGLRPRAYANRFPKPRKKARQAVDAIACRVTDSPEEMAPVCSELNRQSPRPAETWSDNGNYALLCSPRRRPLPNRGGVLESRSNCSLCRYL